MVKYLQLMLREYPKSMIERNLESIKEAVTKTISDASQEVRAVARDSFKNIQGDFPDAADAIFSSADV